MKIVFSPAKDVTCVHTETIVFSLCCRDNPDVDIFGANLYHRYLQKKKEKMKKLHSSTKQSAGGQQLHEDIEGSNGVGIFMDL